MIERLLFVHAAPRTNTNNAEEEALSASAGFGKGTAKGKIHSSTNRWSPKEHGCLKPSSSPGANDE